MAPPIAIFNKHQEDTRLPGAANRRDVAITMASSCSEWLRRVPWGWLHLGGVRIMLMLRLADSDAVEKTGMCEISVVSANCAITEAGRLLVMAAEPDWNTESMRVLPNA